MKNIERICEWSGEKFLVDYKHRNQRFVNREAMYEWRKSLNRESACCLNCGGVFERYKRLFHIKTGRLTEYCSDKCRNSSPIARGKKKKWTTENNPMKNESSVLKIRQTKMERYGDETYNNLEKNKETCLRKYGVSCVFDIPSVIRSNGRRVSKFQNRIYEEVKLIHKDAILEHYLNDASISVDIFVPSKKLVIECYGDYWHCNPLIYKEDFYNKSLKMTAKETWIRDELRIKLLKSFGYDVNIIWENLN